jgi:hypothetical protein
MTMFEERCMRWASLGLAITFGTACTDPEPEPEPEPDPPRTCLDFDEIVSDVPDFPLVYETEHLDVHVEPERFLCAGSVIDYERHVQYVANQLGIEIQRRIPVYAMRWASEYCTGNAACATRDGVVFATPATAYHELAHGVSCEIRTGGPSILAEGLAVSFEPRDNTSLGVPQEFSEIHRSEFGYYYLRAGHFVRWLAEQLGPDAFAALYRTASYDGGVWTAMASAYGSSLAIDYAAESPAMWIPHRQCADMPLLEPEADGGWVFEARFDCDDEATLGPYEKTDMSEANGNIDMFQSFLIDVPEPGTYRLESSHGNALTIYYERCLDEHPATEQEIKEERRQGSVFFTLFDDYGLEEFEHAGLWRIDVLHDYGPPVDVWLTMTPEPEP